MNVRESVKELQLLCERLAFKHIIIIILPEEIIVFTYFVRINNPVLKACYGMYSYSVKFTLVYSCFDIGLAFDLGPCSEVDIRN